MAALVSRMFARVSLIIWMVGAVAVGATLQARHLLALPTGSIAQAVRDDSATMLRGSKQTLAVWHVLSADCACSRKVAAHLAERAVIDGTIETIVWVSRTGDAPQTGAMLLVTVTPDELQRRFGAIAAPQIIAIDSLGAVRYVGGYSKRKQGSIEDTRIIAALARGADTAPLPVFGCAVAQELVEKTDPVGLEAIAQKVR